MKRTSISHSRKLTILCLALTLFAVAGALSTARGASAAGTADPWRYWQLDRDSCRDAATLDADGNGNAEQAWFDIDNDCRWDTHLYNTRGDDGLLEAASFDMDENGVPEYLMLDINQRVGYEWLYVDLNQDRVYEQRRIIPGSDADVINRANANTLNNAAFHQFTMRTGESLLFPSFRIP